MTKAHCRVTEFGPVCPQIIPDLSDEQEALRWFYIFDKRRRAQVFLDITFLSKEVADMMASTFNTFDMITKSNWELPF